MPSLPRLATALACSLAVSAALPLPASANLPEDVANLGFERVNRTMLRVTRETFRGEWPWTVPALTLRCDLRPGIAKEGETRAVAYVTARTDDGREIGLTPTARHLPIPFTLMPSLTANIRPFIRAGVALCPPGYTEEGLFGRPSVRQP